MAIGTETRRLLYARALAHITLSGGAWNLTAGTRELLRGMPNLESTSFVEYLNVTRQALRDWTAGQAFRTGHGTVLDQHFIPVDPTIGRDPATGAAEVPFRARILVTVTRPDHTTASTLVIVDTDGTQTAAQLRARAEQAVQNDLGTVNVPPTFSARAAGNPTWSSQVITIGRAGG